MGPFNMMASFKTVILALFLAGDYTLSALQIAYLVASRGLSLYENAQFPSVICFGQHFQPKTT